MSTAEIVTIKQEYRNLPVAQLVESSTNPRRRFEENGLKELAASFQSQGILQPLLVRKLAPEQYEVIAGARRFRAAKIATLETVPVRIVALSDSAVIEAQAIENLQRENIHPMEEAIGFQAAAAPAGAGAWRSLHVRLDQWQECRYSGAGQTACTLD